MFFPVYLAQIPGRFQNQFRILGCIFKCFSSTDPQSDILLQFFLNLLQASPRFYCIGSTSAEIFLISGIIRTDDLSRLLCISKQIVLITVNFKTAVFLVLKPQSIGLLLSIIIGYQQGIGITHNHTLVRYIQPLLFTESKALLSEVDPLSAFFLQISFHGVKIFLLQPGKYIDSCRSQPVIYINIRFVRVLHRNSCLYLQTFTLIKSILRRKLQYTFHCVNACQFHIHRRNIPENRNMQCICICINCIENLGQFLSDQFAAFIYFYSYCRNIMRYDHIIYLDHRAPYCGIFFHSPYASQTQGYHKNQNCYFLFSHAFSILSFYVTARSVIFILNFLCS